jgi:O-methyltransferase involved in polyketide biosynthesis
MRGFNLERTMESVLIDLTEEQQEALFQMIRAMKPGEATLAQVYYDGMRVRVFSAEKALAIQAAIGDRKPDEPMFSSAYEAHAYAKEKAHND